MNISRFSERSNTILTSQRQRVPNCSIYIVFRSVERAESQFHFRNTDLVMGLTYRPEVDGLRTIAVGAVLIYHAKFSVAGMSVLNGGFLGVDIFFVISGFLITSLILQEWERTGTFSIANFYERRARRLLPALFVVIFAALPIAWGVLLPSQMVDFVKSLLASVLFISNMYWNGSLQTYGAESGLLKPFLHTWSLAVEEQFYIFFPLLFMAALRRMRPENVLLGLIAMVGVGLIVAEVTTAYDFNLSFYWLISRTWELLAGSILAHFLFHHPQWGKSYALARFMPGLGLALILGAMLMMRLSLHHPGIGTVPAVLGTMLIIWFATPAEPVTRLLGSRVFVGIGLISYSLYLWHYPIFAFGRLLSPNPAVWEKGVWIAMSLLLAFLSYRIVETPFRRSTVVSRGALIASSLTATALVAVFATTMLMQDGRKARFPDLIALYGINEFDNPALQDRSWDVLADLAAAKGLEPSKPHDPSEYERAHLWFDTTTSQTRMLLIGNSHSKDMFNAVHLNADAFPGYQFARFGMRANLNRDDIAALFSAPNFKAADVVAVAFRYTPRTLQRLPRLLERLQLADKDVVILLNTVEFQEIDALPVFDWYLRNTGAGYNPADLNAFAYEHRDLSETEHLNSRLREIAGMYDIPLRAKSLFICNDPLKTCTAVTPEGQKVFFDYGHFTLEGAAYFGKRMAALNWLKGP